MKQTGVAFLREKVREGRAAAARVYRVKGAEEDGVAHGAVPDPDLDTPAYRDNAIDQAFTAYEQYIADPSAMTQPGVLHGVLNRWDATREPGPDALGPPILTSPTAK